MDKTIIIIGVLTVAVFGVIIGSTVLKKTDNLPRSLCVQHAGLGMHIHPMLSIFIEDQPVNIPANIGIDPNCMKAIHTHDESGKLHLEYPEVHEFVLGDFFANWNMPFSANQIMDKSIDDNHILTMTVDGNPNNEFEKLVLKDEQQIIIRYELKK